MIKSPITVSAEPVEVRLSALRKTEKRTSTGSVLTAILRLQFSDWGIVQ